MKINGSSNSIGLQHMAARAQEARKPNSAAETIAAATALAAASTTSETTTGGNNVPATGENLPPTTAKSSSKPDHATGLSRAIERLEANALKNPQAKGLQHALEILQGKLGESGTVVDTEA